MLNREQRYKRLKELERYSAHSTPPAVKKEYSKLYDEFYTPIKSKRRRQEQYLKIGFPKIRF